MKWMRSQFLVWLSLVALASFLAFWLWQEFERTRANLVTEQHLKLAEGMLSEKDEALAMLTAKVEELRNGQAVQLTFALDDSTAMPGIDSSKRPTFEDTRIQIFTSDSMGDLKSAHKVKGDTTMAIVMAYNSEGYLESNIEFSRVLQSGEPEEFEGINRQALLAIWPQGLFAVALFGLLLLGIALLRRNHARQQALLAQKNSLISNLTHELKTPVATVSVALEALERFNVRDDKEKTANYLKTSRKELKRLAQSIDMVMQLSILDQDAAVFQFEATEVLALCSEAVELLQPQLDAAGMSATISGAEDLSLPLDRTHFRNAIINLVDNAIKYAASGKTLDVVVADQGANVRISVTDEGRGIATDQQQHVFDRFHRVAQGDAHNVKGHGLGLSYVKEIAEAHGGRIHLHSEPGKGARFELIIPKKPPHGSR